MNKNVLKNFISKIKPKKEMESPCLHDLTYSIAIYKDRKENILIIPQAFDEDGVRRDVNKPIVLKAPYEISLLGKCVLESFEAIIKEPYQHSKSAVKVYELATGIKSWTKFAKQRLFVYGSYNDKKGYEFSPWKRYSDFSYRNFENEEIILGAGVNADVDVIGELVVKAFDYLDKRKVE